MNSYLNKLFFFFVIFFLFFSLITYVSLFSFFFFFFNDTATTEIYTLSLHDALPIYVGGDVHRRRGHAQRQHRRQRRSEEHTSDLQSHQDLVCRLKLEKKKQKQ